MRERVLNGLEMDEHGEKLCENAKSMNEYLVFQTDLHWVYGSAYHARASIAIRLICL